MIKLIIGVMHSNEELLEELKEILKEKFGEIEGEINYDFNFTKYYEEEMGKNLKKNLLVFKQEIKEQPAEIKIYTNQLEDKYRVKGKKKNEHRPWMPNRKRTDIA